ncbi:16S rRNA (uracil(1498)-N(3))-methyltransferase [Kribbia dieselivorans]|uniref:16S rRNA (uracil(1498)-N(3))-methyltransferase n=1 Tax=Kribbia dieselivorans TaxID=331526 RepID=UPI0008382FCD|nr:16S rRNA (uracil(1498)-N(3))-methyltransferase [Kribbia dieselivorans]
MTAPVFLVDAAALAAATVGGVVRLDGDEGQHAATVHRLTAGESITLTDGEGRGVHGEVVEVGKGWLDVRVHELVLEPEPALQLVLVQALAKGGRDEQAVEAAVELGVDTVIAWQADRSISRWRGDKAERGVRKWTNVVTSAMKQSRRLRRPTVEFAGSTTDLATRLRTVDAVLLLHEEAEVGIGAARFPQAGTVGVVVGPEGGISPEEVAALAHVGAQPVRLGPHVLRSSTAGPVGLTVLASRTRWTT